jgi:hypothetical protein
MGRGQANIQILSSSDFVYMVLHLSFHGFFASWLLKTFTRLPGEIDTLVSFLYRQSTLDLC